MLRAARQRILVLDGTKFDKVSFVEIAPLREMDIVVTNTQPPQRWLEVFEKAGVRVLYPGAV